MFKGKLKKHRKTIWEWYEKERDNEYPSKKVISALKWIAKSDKLKDYGYHGDWKSSLEYCSDRMNGGRAKAILRLLRRGKA